MKTKSDKCLATAMEAVKKSSPMWAYAVIKKRYEQPSPYEHAVRKSSRGGMTWEDGFDSIIPSSGSGRFMYQRMHGDDGATGTLWLEGDAYAYGWTARLGNDGDSILSGKGQTILEIESERDKMDVVMRLKKGYIGIDDGYYRLGVVTKDLVELFLDGEGLNGRYLIQRYDDGNTAHWMMARPESQDPMSNNVKMEDAVKALAGKGHEVLMWPKDGGGLSRIDVQLGTVTKSSMIKVPIKKADDEKKIVYGVVLDPYQEKGLGGDFHGDVISPAEIEKTAHDFMKSSRVVSLDHSGIADGAYVVESFIEGYPTRDDYKKALNGEPHTVSKRELGDDVIHSGAWVMGTQLSDELWDKYKSGDIQSYSIEGTSYRRPITPFEIPAVRFVDLKFYDTEEGLDA